MEKEQERQRKADIKRGQRTQKMMAFRIDTDVLEALEKRTSNKGRYINEVLKKYLGL